MSFIETLRTKHREWTRYRLRKKLKNDDFSILCPNCIGGVIYHELGKQFLSPTINLWMHDKDFYKFVGNIHYYLGQRLKFVKFDNEQTPVAYLDDILIHFNHYKTELEAANKWYERCKRIKWDNLFIIASDRPHGSERVTDEDIIGLQKVKCRGKVVFAVRNIVGVDYIVHLPEDNEIENKDIPYVKAYMFDKTFFLKQWRWEQIWDYVSWLNNEK